MAQKYLTLEEAAERLSMSVDELKQLARRGEIRAFIDRGTFKFREQDIEEFGRQRLLGSGAEVDLGSGSEALLSQSSHSDEVQLADHLLPDAGPGSSGARVVTFSDSDIGPSDSDVRLVAEPSDNPSDSDVRIAPAASAAAPNDSDVRPVQAAEEPSDSDVKLATPAAEAASDSDARLPEPAPVPPDSASEGTEAEAVMVSEPDSDFELSDDASDTDFEISLEPSSGGEEDLIDLEAEGLGDSAVAKPVDVTAGSPSESGVALDSPADSGISLEEPPSVLSEQTDAGVADLDAVLGSDASDEAAVQEESSENISLVPGEPVEPSGFELEQEGSDFDLDLSDDTAQIPLLDDDSQILDLEEEVPVDESAATAMAAPALDEEPAEAIEEGGLGAGVMEMPGAMAAAPPTQAVGAPTAPIEQAAMAGVPVTRVAPEPDWPTWVVVVMSIASVLLAFTGLMMADLVRTMWGWENQSLYSSPILEWLRGLFF